MGIGTPSSHNKIPLPMTYSSLLCGHHLDGDTP